MGFSYEIVIFRLIVGVVRNGRVNLLDWKAFFFKVRVIRLNFYFGYSCDCGMFCLVFFFNFGKLGGDGLEEVGRNIRGGGRILIRFFLLVFIMW